MDNDIKIINLSSPDKKPIMIEETRFISIGKELFENTQGIFAFIKRFCNRHQHIEKTVLLEISDIQVDPNLVINDEKSLFTIFHDVEKTVQKEFPLKIHLSRLKEPFFLLFNSNQIQDCTKIQNSDTPDTFYISYRLVLKDKDGKVINGKEGELESIAFQFTHESNIPNIKLIKDDNNLPLQYKSGAGIIKVGILVVQLPNILQYAPSVDLKIDLKLVDEDNVEVPDFLVIRKNSNKVDIIDEKGIRSKAQSNGKATVASKYDILLNVDKIANPMVDIAKYLLIGDPRYKYSYESTYKPFKDLAHPIDVLKDKQGTELVVFAERNGNVLKDDCSSWNISPIDFTSTLLTYPVKLFIKNKATDTSRPGAGLTISNLLVHSNLPEGLTIHDKHQEKLSVTRIINLYGQEPELESLQGLFVANGEGSETSFSINFTPENIYSIRKDGQKVYNFSIITVVEFDYVEDSEGFGKSKRKHFKRFLNWDLCKKPNPEWLCVDYGSSAIVCYYGKGSDSEIINLRNARTKVYSSAKYDEKNNPNGFKDIRDEIEADTPFLPSDILFNDVKGTDFTGLCSQLDVKAQVRYNSMVVLLSPTEKLRLENFIRQLPCLKVLMGNMFLPDNDHYRAIRYCYIDGIDKKLKDDVASNLKDSEYSLLKIDNIFREAYYTLFHFFIQDETIIEQANKIVLTYPNTYTPCNLMTLESIVKKTLSGIREVQFVGESDAVAAYYMAHWKEYHSDSEDMTVRENILVYDMGAGTLDVTYFTKYYETDSSKYTLEICGKIGTGRAGNYMDYVIAQILYKRLREDNFKKSWINTDTKAVEEVVLGARVELKLQIKNKIKPSLSSNSPIKFNIGKSYFVIAPNEILNDELFVEFLNQVTDNIWNNLKKYGGEQNFKIDTIIMSGRSLRLVELQNRIGTLAQKENANCIMLDIITNGIDKGKKNDRLKTAVVEGAKTFVEIYLSNESPVIIRSRRLQASYGVAFKRTGGTWEYCELLSRHDIPFSENKKVEFSRPNGPLLVKHTNESDVLRFIQTYLSEDDTRQALNFNDEEYISIMSEVMMSDFDNKASLKMNVIVDKNNNVSLYVNGMETPYKAPAGIDLNNEIIKRSLWPVSIVND